MKDTDNDRPQDDETDPFEFFDEDLDDLDEYQWLPHLINQSDLKLPKELHSCFSEAPFEICIECGCDILNDGTTYVVQKAKRNGETVLELAICMTCAQGVKGTMSEESRETMEQFMGEMAANAEDHEEGTCLACGFQVDQKDGEYEIAGMAMGPILITPILLFCAKCHEELDSKLSEETRKGGEDFIEKNFPGIPADIGLPISFLGG